MQNVSDKSIAFSAMADKKPVTPSSKHFLEATGPVSAHFRLENAEIRASHTHLWGEILFLGLSGPRERRAPYEFESSSDGRVYVQHAPGLARVDAVDGNHVLVANSFLAPFDDTSFS
ncbi:hypothetical protein LCGC14_1983060 [marine sediment metagenome]|uniref:Uncharacterized protein n=1 Tax=marine sediment metagenome TaxID=412755 RepID=A0A0F9HLJ4_9ZZZZ